MDERKPIIPEVLSCLLVHEPETQLWLGQCLDFDLVTSGKDPDNAWENLRAVIKTHVEHCFTFHQEGLCSRASKEDWALFEALKAKQPLMRTEKITLRLVAPQTEQVPAFWIQGVESSFLGEDRGQGSAAAVQAIN